MISLVFISVFVGLLIGAVGIGGVLLVPALAYIAGLDVHQAIPACMLSYLATGAVGVAVYARHGSIKWPMVMWICVGAVPSAFLGSLALPWIPASLVMLLIAVLMVFAGLDALLKAFQFKVNRRAVKLTPKRLIVIGFVTGFGSSITGTGGPLIIVPLVLFLGLPILTTIGLSQAIQIPIATFASLGNWLSGSLNLELSLVIAVSMVVGSLVGATLVHRLPIDWFRKFVAILLIIVGCVIAVRLLSF